MAKKGNRILAILSTIILFSIVAVLYTVPSVLAIKGEYNITNTQTEPVDTVNEIEKDKNIDKDITTKIEPEKKEEKEPQVEEKVLHVNRTLDIKGNSAIVDAYDGYGYVQLPSSLSLEHINNAMNTIAKELPTLVEELKYKFDGDKLNLTYNQGYTEAEISSLLDTVQILLSTHPSIIPAKPNVYVEDQSVQYDEFLIEKTFNVLGLDINIVAERGIATFTYPSTITQSDIATALVDMHHMLNGNAIEFDAALSDGMTELFYSELYSEEDILFALSFIESYLKTIKAPEPVIQEVVQPVIEVEIETSEVEEFIEVEVKVPQKPNVTIESQILNPEPVIEHIHREILNLVTIDAYNGYATISLPEGIEKEFILDNVVALYSCYGPYMSDIDFALDGNTLTATYSSGYTEEEVSLLIDAFESFILNIKLDEKEEVVNIVEVIEPIRVERELKALGIPFQAVAFDGSAIIEYPANLVTKHDVLYGLMLVENHFKDFAKDVYSDVYEGKIVLTYPEGFTKAELEYALDELQAYLETLVIPEPVVEVVDVKVKDVKVPAKPEFIIHSISRDLNVLGEVVHVEAHDGRALFTLPEGIPEEVVATVLSDMYYNEYLNDFEFGIDGNVVEAQYSTNYTDSEVNAFIDFIDTFLSNVEVKEEKPIEIKIPRKPQINVASQTISVPTPPVFDDGITHIERTIIVDDVEVKANAYDGYATFDFEFALDQEFVASTIADLYSEFGAMMADFDFALDSNSIEAKYSEGYTEEEISAMLDSLEMHFSKKK